MLRVRVSPNALEFARDASIELSNAPSCAESLVVMERSSYDGGGLKCALDDDDDSTTSLIAHGNLFLMVTIPKHQSTFSLSDTHDTHVQHQLSVILILIYTRIDSQQRRRPVLAAAPCRELRERMEAQRIKDEARVAVANMALRAAPAQPEQELHHQRAATGAAATVPPTTASVMMPAMKKETVQTTTAVPLQQQQQRQQGGGSTISKLPTTASAPSVSGAGTAVGAAAAVPLQRGKRGPYKKSANPAKMQKRSPSAEAAAKTTETLAAAAAQRQGGIATEAGMRMERAFPISVIVNASDRKRNMVMSELKKVVAPDMKSPFANKEDAFDRLFPYHVRSHSVETRIKRECAYLAPRLEDECSRRRRRRCSSRETEKKTRAPFTSQHDVPVFLRMHASIVDVCLCAAYRATTETPDAASARVLTMCVCAYTCVARACVHLQLVHTEDDIDDVVAHPSMGSSVKDMARMTPRELLDAYTKTQEMRVDRCRDTLSSLSTRFSKLVDTVNGDAMAVEETHQIVKLLYDEERKVANAVKQEQRIEQEKWATERRQMRHREIRAVQEREMSAKGLSVPMAQSLDLGAPSIGAAAARAAISEQKVATIPVATAPAAAKQAPQPS